MVDFTLDKVNEILEQLKGIRIKEAISLRKRLQKEKEKLVPKQKPIKLEVSKLQRKQIANQNRSKKLERYWRYIKLIRDNFPDLKTNQIRAELKKRSQGQKSEIPDAIWQNPSA